MLTDKSYLQRGSVKTFLGVPRFPYLYVMPSCVVEDDEGGWGVARHPLWRDEAEVPQGVVAKLEGSQFNKLVA